MDKSTRPRSRTRWPLVVAAVLLLVGGASAGWWFSRPVPARQDRLVAALEAAGYHVRVVAPDVEHSMPQPGIYFARDEAVLDRLPSLPRANAVKRGWVGAGVIVHRPAMGGPIDPDPEWSSGPGFDLFADPAEMSAARKALGLH